MRKIKFFFTVFKRSLTEPEYYQEIAKAKFAFSLKYLYFLLILVSLIGAFRFSVKVSSYLPKIPDFIRETKVVITNLYPEDLVLTVKDGQLSTNVSEPYFIDLPNQLDDFKVFDKSPDVKHLVAIDTSASVDEFEKYKSAVLLTNRYIITVDDKRGYNVRQIKGIVTDLTIDKDNYDTLVSRVLSFLNYLPHLAVAAVLASLLVWPFLGGLFALGYRLIWLLIATVFVLVIAKIMKKDLGYKKLYQFGMHAVTIPILIALIFDLIVQPRPFLLTLLLFLVFMGLVLYRYPSSETADA